MPAFRADCQPARGVLHLKVETAVEALLGRLRLRGNPEAALRGELHELLHAHRSLLGPEHLDRRVHQREVLARRSRFLGRSGPAVLRNVGLGRLICFCLVGLGRLGFLFPVLDFPVFWRFRFRLFDLWRLGLGFIVLWRFRLRLVRFRFFGLGRFGVFLRLAFIGVLAVLLAAAESGGRRLLVRDVGGCPGDFLFIGLGRVEDVHHSRGPELAPRAVAADEEPVLADLHHRRGDLPRRDLDHDPHPDLDFHSLLFRHFQFLLCLPVSCIGRRRSRRRHYIKPAFQVNPVGSRR